MKTLLIILIVIAIPFIIALFTKKDYRVKREITIRKPQQAVFDYLKLLKNHDHFNEWVMADPNLQKEFTGTDGTAGFVYYWKGNKKAGEGEQELKRIVPNQQIDVEIRFIKPFEGVAQTSFVITGVSTDETRVSWDMQSKMNYPMNMALWFLNIEKFLGEPLQKSLDNLKANLEK